MDFFEIVAKRRSVRLYLEKEIEREKLQKILEAANSAPSAGDLQGYEIVVVKTREQKEALSKAARGQRFIAQAPVALVLIANQKKSATRYGERGARLYSIQDATIAGSYIQLAATALGLATCWIGSYDDKETAKVVGADMEEGMVPVAIIPIGYTAELPNARPRREISDLVHQGKL
ncbi:MAG: nitroreductase family protein [Candidatus Atabeyarchaeum deiterrae]